MHLTLTPATPRLRPHPHAYAHTPMLTPTTAIQYVRPHPPTDVGLDDHWQACGSPQAAPGMHYHDDKGTPIVDLSVFPDFKAMTGHAHSLNLTSGWWVGATTCSACMRAWDLCACVCVTGNGSAGVTRGCKHAHTHARPLVRIQVWKQLRLLRPLSHPRRVRDADSR